MTDHTYSLRLPFDNDDPMFVRGVELGRLWQLAQDPRVHATNREMIIRVAEATDREFKIESVDDTWVEVWLGS